MNIDEKIAQIIQNNNIVLFLKGTKNFPQCGFSGRAIQILKTFNVTFLDVNVLADQEIREGIKTYSNWPTIPQLYVKGEFVGGSDIMYEMYQSGEFKQLLQNAGLIID
jgi:monothiol glutaredoxin